MAIPFVYVRAQGSYREIGRQVGEAARAQIQASLAFFADNFVAMSGGLEFGAAELEAAAYLRYARAFTPHAVEELEGMAEGAGVAASALLVPNCGEEFTSNEPVTGAQPLAPGCTAVAVVSQGRHIVGHNMDWYVIDAPNNVLFDLTVPDGTRLLAFAGAAYLPIVGLNSHGLGNVSNSVCSTDNRLGIPNVFVRRATMEAATLETARERGLPAARARGTNQFFADTAGRLWDIESSATASALADHGAAATWRTPTTTSLPRWRPSRAPTRPNRAPGCAPPRTCSPPGSTTARSRSISWPVSCAATSPRRRTASAVTPSRTCRGRAGHDGGQHHLRPGRAPPVRLRRPALRHRLRDLRHGLRPGGRRPRASIDSERTARRRAASTARRMVSWTTMDFDDVRDAQLPRRAQPGRRARR